MQKSAHFRVNPKLAHVLGENYTSSEKALKELIDNAWDAEATEVRITVLNILTEAPVIVQDTGSGMKTAELEAEYFNIASPRFSRKSDHTPTLNRIVNGSKGMGKFAGLTHTNEFNLAKPRLSKQMKQRLESVPEHRRTIAEERITRLMQPSFQEGEKLERMKAIDSSATTTLRSATMPTRRASLVLSESVASCGLFPVAFLIAH